MTSGWDWHGDPGNAELYELISQCVVEFSMLEACVGNVIFDLAVEQAGDAGGEVGGTLTWTMSIPVMIDAIGALMGGEIPSDLDRVLKQVLELNERRNDLVHASWAAGLPGDRGHEYQRVGLRRKAGVVSKDTFESLDSIREFRDDIVRVTDSLFVFLKLDDK